MLSKRYMKLMALVAALFATLALAACGSEDSDDSGGGSGSSDGPVTIEFWHGQTQKTGKVVQKMIDRFNASQSEVVVSKDSGGVNSDRMLQKVTAGLQADNVPDIAYIFGSDLANLAQGDKLANLSDAVDSGELEWDHFIKPARDSATVDGEPRAVPSFIDNLAVVYNKKIFDEANEPYPTDDWSWDDFLTTAKKLNNPSKGIAGFAWPGTGDEDTTWRFWPLVWQAGGDVLSEDGESAGFGGEPGEQALGVIEQAQKDGSVYIDSTAGSERMQQLMSSGKMAMNIAGPYTLPEYRDAGLEWGVVDLPSFGDEHTTIAGPDTWAIFDNGDERMKAAIKFMNWFNEPEQQLEWIMESGSLPLTSDVEKAKGFDDYENSLPGLKAFVENTERARIRPTIPQYPRISEAVGSAVAKVLYGKASPADALKAAVDQSDSALQVPGS